MHAPHLCVTAAVAPVVILGVMEHIDEIAVLVVRPHAMTGAKLPTAVVHAGFLQRIIEFRPCCRVGQIGIGSGWSLDKARRVVDATSEPE